MMSSYVGARMNVFNESFLNETDQDANSVLTELDKGLRSTKIGEQCEAIVRFPRMFEKYPFPILINSSFLKLAEFFRNGSNLLRLWVLKVCQQSDKHLDKILNIDEFVKRIFMVIHSNDPVARALTLRTLGAVSRVIPEKQQVHHSIRRALDSNDTVEVEAAIYASVQFAAQSKTFAISMCSKIGSMIESLKTPISMKLQLIPVLRHMYHDANTAALVKTLCLNLLPKYPAESFVIAILDSLTKLSCKTLIDIPDQVNLLLTYLQDPRKKVRYQVLRSLRSLAQEGAHLWPNGALKTLISKAQNCNDVGNEQSLVLTVVLTLTECPVTCHALLNEEQNLILELCSSCLVLEHHTAASQAVGILTGLISYCHTENIPPPTIFMELINLHLESLIYSSMGNEKKHKELTLYMKCGVKLSENNLQFAQDFVQLIEGIVTDNCVYSKKNSVLLCETLAALSSQFQVKRFSIHDPKHEPSTSMDVDPHRMLGKKMNPVSECLPQILKKMDTIIDGELQPHSVQIVEILSAVVLQSIIGSFMPKGILDVFDRISTTINCWSQYRIARSASRYGQHFLAARFYTKLATNVSLDKFHFFLIALSQMSKAECILNYGAEYEVMLHNYVICDPKYYNPSIKLLSLTERLDKAIALYAKALASIKASSSPSSSLTFQSEFIKLRCQFLQALYSVVIAKNTQAIVPPPAIALTLAQSSRDVLQKYGHITNQLRKAVKTIKGCEDAYSKLYKSAFDADPTTLEFLEITQHQCAIFGHIVESVCFVSPSEPPCLPTEGNHPETKYLVNTCNKIERLAKTLPQESPNDKSITMKHTKVIIEEIELITMSPMCFPRFFFQVLQNTIIKLSISPQPRVAGEPIIVQPGSNLVVKVEGVIQHYGKSPCLFRSVESVQLTLTSQLVSQRNPNDLLKQPNDTITLTQTVKPQRDFLSGNFLLSLNNVQTGPMGNPISMGGQWQVTLDTYIIDENGTVWCTGNKNSLTVRVPDDPSKQAAVAATQPRRF
ncbi:unnamed protein product [Hermetia illucens]|uniref:Integrator complex subunit 7 n=1 Tax=Hermetia illucens TaxID=343691 RepID=A0A7R8V3A3_HERIL|nr:integrator complex subunit 7 [Hermetia illucens]CAD7091372.1 unnamed protein product [Hermetia illucens]